MNIISHKALLLLILAMAGINQSAWSQISIKGPTCVMPGISYQYLISGKWDSTSTMQVCIQNGVIVPLSNTCTTNGSPLASVSVVWTTGVATGSVNLTSNSGSSNLAVAITSALRAGSISAASDSQSVAYQSIPGVIHCSPDSGGSCTPVYTYQWQQSVDNSHWSNIPQATSQDLAPNSSLAQTTYFRRRTMEKDSGSIAFSNLAIVWVAVPPTSATTPAN